MALPGFVSRNRVCSLCMWLKLKRWENEGGLFVSSSLKVSSCMKMSIAHVCQERKQQDSIFFWLDTDQCHDIATWQGQGQNDLPLDATFNFNKINYSVCGTLCYLNHLRLPSDITAITHFSTIQCEHKCGVQCKHEKQTVSHAWKQGRRNSISLLQPRISTLTLCVYIEIWYMRSKGETCLAHIWLLVDERPASCMQHSQRLELFGIVAWADDDDIQSVSR